MRFRVAAVASYEDAYALVRAHGEARWTSRLVPLTVDGLIYASSMVMLDSARRKGTGSTAGAVAAGPASTAVTHGTARQAAPGPRHHPERISLGDSDWLLIVFVPIFPGIAAASSFRVMSAPGDELG